MTCLLGTTFADGQGLSALLATGRQEQSDTIQLPVAQGKDRKLVAFVDLMFSVWDSGFSPCPSKMLQKELELQ